MRVTRRAAPVGSLVMNGNVAGTPLSLSSTSAYGALWEGASESEFGIFHATPYERETSLVVYVRAGLVRAQTYTVGGGPGEVDVRAQHDEDDEDATSGTVTITAVGSSLVGTYDVTLPSGPMTGSFDVDVELNNLP